MSCSRPKDAKNPAAPVATAVTPQYAYAQTNDLRVAPQLGGGWYDIEDGAWRWMAKEALATLKNPGVFPAQFEVRLVLPNGTMTAVKGPVIFAVFVNDKPLGEETYRKEGPYQFEKTVPPGMVGPGSVKVTLRVNKAKGPIPGGAARELAAITEGFGSK